MKTLIHSSVLAVYLVAISFANALVIPKHEKRILGGYELSDAIPFAVKLLFTVNGELINCGGSIISKNHIVTAAHCVYGRERQLYSTAQAIVGYGSNDITKQTRVAPLEIIPHPEYSHETLQNDIAVISVPDIEPYQNAQAVSIYNGTVGSSTELVSFGWGYTVNDGNTPFPNKLKRAVVRVGSEEECRQLYPNFRSSDGPDICIINRHHPESITCQGDSGTGAVVSSGGASSLVGVVSRGGKLPGSVCDSVDGFTIFTHVKHYLRFISSATGLPISDLTRSY